MELVYATRRVPECKDRRFINPRFFSRPEPGTTKVYVERGQDRIAEAYRAAGVPVVIIGAKDKAAVPVPPEGLVERVIAVIEPDPVETMTDDELREAIRAATGRRPHARTGREKLIARYRTLR